MKPAKSKRAKKLTHSNSRQKTILLFTLAGVILLSAAAYLYWVNRLASPSETGTASSPSADAIPKADIQQLIGDWVRPDGGYVISIRRIFPDGRAEAAYLNPRRVNVARAEATAAGDTARLFMELQDVGYPGSTYELVYDPQKDLLAGVYFQAAIGQRFDVLFVRAK
jgi:hypothetical protein